jgi:hypothetical protein
VPASPEATVRVARIVAAAATLAPLPLVAIAAAIAPIDALQVLFLPAIGLGVVGFAGGLVAHARLVGTPRPEVVTTERAQRFLTGTLVPLALTEAAALVGAMAFAAGRNAWALLPVVAHLALAMLVWPTRSRFDRAFGANPPVPR